MILLHALNASEWTGPTGNNTYLFPGPPSILIDAGVGHPEHVDAIARALEGRPLDVLLITHNHSDHAKGTPQLLARWPRLIVRGGPGVPLHDGEVFETRGERLSALYTPGHAPDHYCFVNKTTRETFCGDLARVGGTIVIPASKGGNLQAYVNSLLRVRALNPPRLFPAHGPVIEDPERLLDEYVAHRQLRDRQVRAALAAGLTTPDEIVAHLYPRLSAALVPAARESVLAHLQQIRDES